MLSLFSSTACCASSSSNSNSTFPGFESQSRQAFVLWLQWQLILINRQSYSKSILHWFSVAKSWEKEKKRKKGSWLRFEAQTWKRGIWSGIGTGTERCGGKEGKRPMIAYCLTQCSNGCSLGSLLFPRQDYLVERCTTLRVYLHNHTVPSSLVWVDDFSRNAVRQFENNKTIKTFTLFRIAISKQCNFLNQEILVREKPWPWTRKRVRKLRRRWSWTLNTGESYYG